MCTAISYLKGDHYFGRNLDMLQDYRQQITTKHQDATSLNVLEYLMYQTGNIIRLLITLKQSESA